MEQNIRKVVRKIISEEIKEPKKKLYVLVGPPAVGKSYWISKTFGGSNPHIVSRDEFVDEVAAENGLKYDDMFDWKDSKISDLNKEVNRRLASRFSAGIGADVIVVDMTNMSAKTRAANMEQALGGKRDEYEKIAVVFEFRGLENLIQRIADRRAKKLGTKNIGPDVYKRMFDSYQDVSSEEGFDEVISVNNSKELMDSLKVK